MICQALRLADVPSVLWGNFLLTIYGVPSIVDGFAFIVPNDQMQTASSALEQAGFPLCTMPQDCAALYRFQARPALAHFHICTDFVVSLHQKSDTLWELDGLKSVQLEDDGPDVMSASDPPLPTATLGRGRGRLPPASAALVRVPKAARFCEALILLLCRDTGTMFENYWIAWLTYILEYVDGTEAFDYADLRDEFKPFYEAMKFGDTSMFLRRDELREQLISSGRL